MFATWQTTWQLPQSFLKSHLRASLVEPLAALRLFQPFAADDPWTSPASLDLGGREGGRVWEGEGS